MKSEKIIFALVMIVLFGAAIYFAVDFQPDERRAPLVVAVPSFLLMIMVLADELRSRPPEKNEVKIAYRETLHVAEARRRELAVILWILLLVAMIYVLGFLWAVPLYLLAMLKLRGRETWRVSVFLTAGTVVVIYFFFVSLLKVNLHPGLWGS